MASAPNTHHPTPPASAPGVAAAALDTRPASLWPDTVRGAAHSGFASTQFDPQAEARQQRAAQAAAAFDVCRPALALRAVLLVQGLLAVAALATANSLVDWGQRQASASFCGAFATVLWLVVVCALQRPLARAAGGLRAAAVLGLGAGAALAGWWPLWAIGLAEVPTVLRPLGVSAIGVAVAALLWAWLALRVRIWQPANASARLAELQSRIRPHFLFNALNTALALVRVDPPRAERVLEDLGELFRVALAEVGESVSLDEEIALARSYLAIEEVRFGDRLKVHWSVDAPIGAARVPPLVLQPLVENAVRHGIEPAVGGGQVWVRAVARRGQAIVTVSNTVPPEPSTPGHGMALANVRERLRLLHDIAAQCDTWQEAQTFHARIVLPL